MQSVLITGGAGFIGQNLVHAWRAARPADRLTVVDATTYAANIDGSKLATELGNRCHVGFEGGLKTVHWYLDHESWWRDVSSGAYKAWATKNYCGCRRAG